VLFGIFNIILNIVNSLRKGAPMRVKCFDCATFVEASDSEGVALAFLAHAREKHDWPYPEASIRNYAINYAEAEERLTGGTERLDRIAEVAVHPVADDRVADWLRFFDHDGFAGNPDWASCYCLHPHAPPTPDEPERPWRESRAAVCERIRDRSTFGYLAYVGSRCVGWVNASFRSDYGLYRDVDPQGPDPRSVIGVSCFVIAPPYRRHGVASALLDRVIADAAGRGASWVEGYPHHAPEEGDAGHFRGPRSMFEARGFREIERKELYAVLRRPTKHSG
jgi:GNAT superfamily N-acetyltransferase